MTGPRAGWTAGYVYPGAELELFKHAVRWKRYYAVIGQGWMTSLRFLKLFLEQGPDAVPTARRIRFKSPCGGSVENSTSID